MSKQLSLPFESRILKVKLEDLVPTKQVAETVRKSVKYKAILASIPEIGIIEPIQVHARPDKKYDIVHGHLRVEALKELKIAEAPCLVSRSVEAYTYNHMVNRVAPIQANRMILKALDANVPAERIALVLGLSVESVKQHRTLLKEVCPEALELLKDKHVAVGAFREFKRVKPIRQIEMAEMMNAMANYSAAFARSLVSGTPAEQLTEAEAARRAALVRPEDLARLERELHSLEKEFMMAEESYSRNVYDLTLAKGYLKRLLENNRVVRVRRQVLFPADDN